MGAADPPLHIKPSRILLQGHHMMGDAQGDLSYAKRHDFPYRDHPFGESKGERHGNNTEELCYIQEEAVMGVSHYDWDRSGSSEMHHESSLEDDREDLYQERLRNFLHRIEVMYPRQEEDTRGVTLPMCESKSIVYFEGAPHEVSTYAEVDQELQYEESTVPYASYPVCDYDWDPPYQSQGTNAPSYELGYYDNRACDDGSVSYPYPYEYPVEDSWNYGVYEPPTHETNEDIRWMFATLLENQNDLKLRDACGSTPSTLEEVSHDVHEPKMYESDEVKRMLAMLLENQKVSHEEHRNWLSSYPNTLEEEFPNT